VAECQEADSNITSIYRFLLPGGEKRFAGSDLQKLLFKEKTIINNLRHSEITWQDGCIDKQKFFGGPGIKEIMNYEF
jgi:hypothetical protein